MPHYSSLRLARRMMGVPLPSIPLSINYGKGMPADIGMMLNGPTPGDDSALVLSNCTVAGGHHAKQVWKYNTGGILIPDTANENNAIIADYSDATGYKLGDPATDQGGIEQEVLNTG